MLIVTDFGEKTLETELLREGWNPNGILSCSPGLRQCRYPGTTRHPQHPNPNGVASSPS